MSKKPIIAEKVKAAKRIAAISVPFPEKFIKSAELKYLKSKPIVSPTAPRGHLKMRYTKERADRVGKWSWGQMRKWDKATWDATIFPHISGYKSKTWLEIENEVSGKHKRNKSYPIYKICPEAQARLVDIQLEDLDEIFRFRVGFTQRLYGFRICDVFFILWWDPEHKIYPLSRD
ncbi:hypothetical protein [Methylosinus sp. PW1]|uniref:hypothetical protein n=1 Tax=Methylosinus sp. PW1 TaxID=107636 RepID=UPI0012EBA53B|nr:hypothetical protein [Methylosinus sp. PW1]